MILSAPFDRTYTKIGPISMIGGYLAGAVGLSRIGEGSQKIQSCSYKVMEWNV